jgi:hypothetical protein
VYRTLRAGEFALYDEYNPLRKIMIDTATGMATADGTGIEWLLAGGSVLVATIGWLGARALPLALATAPAATSLRNAPAALLACREAVLRHLDDLVFERQVVREGNTYRLPGDTRGTDPVPLPEPQPEEESPMPASKDTTRWPAEKLRELVAAELTDDPKTVRELLDDITRRSGLAWVTRDDIGYALDKLMVERRATNIGNPIRKGRGIAKTWTRWRSKTSDSPPPPAGIHPPPGLRTEGVSEPNTNPTPEAAAKADVAQVTCWDPAEVAAQPKADPETARPYPDAVTEASLHAALDKAGVNAHADLWRRVYWLIDGVEGRLSAALDAASVPAHPDPWHRLGQLVEFTAASGAEQLTGLLDSIAEELGGGHETEQIPAAVRSVVTQHRSVVGMVERETKRLVAALGGWHVGALPEAVTDAIAEIGRLKGAKPVSAPSAEERLHAALDAAGVPKHADPWHRLTLLIEHDREGYADLAAAEAGAASRLTHFLDRACAPEASDPWERLEALVELVRESAADAAARAREVAELRAPRWVHAPGGAMLIGTEHVLIDVRAGRAALYSEHGTYLATVECDRSWTAEERRAALEEVYAIVTRSGSGVPF